MPNVSHLMKVALDDPSLQIPLCPVGTWSGELVKITYRDKGDDNEPLTDKNGDEYAMVRLLCRPATPGEDVRKSDADAWLKAGGPAETVLSKAIFIRGKRSVAAVGNTLRTLGVPTKGRSIDAVASEYKGGVPVLMEVSHQKTNDGDLRENIEEVYPVTA